MANHTTSASSSKPTFVQHHFVNEEQQLDAAKMGMWVFLGTEILFFGGLFLAYIVYRTWYPHAFMEAAKEMNPIWGGINTIVLIGSSLTVAMAIKSAQLNQKRNTSINLIITIVLAGIFMMIKYFEWTHHFSEGIYPGRYYSFHGIANPKASVFFSLYYLMTGLHGIHVLVGMGIMIWMLIKNERGEFNSEYYNPLEISGLYWHLVDIFWIFLFPLFYLIG